MSKDKTTIPAFRDDAKRLKRRKLEDELPNLAKTLETELDEKDELQEENKELREENENLQNRVQNLQNQITQLEEQLENENDGPGAGRSSK